MILAATAFAPSIVSGQGLGLSKGERMVFQQPANPSAIRAPL